MNLGKTIEELSNRLDVVVIHILLFLVIVRSKMMELIIGKVKR